MLFERYAVPELLPDRLLTKGKVLAGKNIKNIVKGTDIKLLNRHRKRFIGIMTTWKKSGLL